MPSMIVALEELEPGHILDEDILNAQGVALLSRNTVLDPRTIQIIRDREFAREIRIRIAGDEIPVLHECMSSVLQKKEATLKSREQVGRFLEMARNVEALDARNVEQLSRDIRPIIRDIFQGESPVFDTLNCLSQHDDYTHQHSWMVMILALSILRACWERNILPPDSQARNDLALGAVLHDIGKTHIPLEILNKPGRLTQREWERIREHPDEGYGMVRVTENLSPLTKAIVAHHHQYLDGSGYGPAERSPLSGEEIPDLVRLVTVADVYDALVSERPYRLGYLPFHALRFLAAGAGSRFDRRFVHVLSRIVLDFPTGSVLLFPEGLIGYVRQASLKQRRNPEVVIVGTFSRASAPKVGKSFRLQNPGIGMPGLTDLVMGAASLECLALKMAGQFSTTGPEEIVGPPEGRTLLSLPDWEETFATHLGFLINAGPRP